MRNKIIIIILFVLFGSQVDAQKYTIFDGSLGTREFYGIFSKYDGNRGGPGDDAGGNDTDERKSRNIFKVNLSSLSSKTISVQYERVMNQRASIALGLRYGPKGNIINSAITSNIKEIDASVITALTGSQITNYAITPEAKIYLGKGYGKGFYIAPFARFENFDLELPYAATLSSGKTIVALIKGSKTGYGGGILFGWQFNINKFICVDWWLAGPYIGPQEYKLSGDIIGGALTTSEISQVKDFFNAPNPLVEFDANITPTRISVSKTTSNPLLRTGFCVGFRF
jgi:hypothetical protein